MDRALICRGVDWKILPWEMDDLDVSEVRIPLTLLRVYDIFQKYAKDLDNLTEQEAEVIGSIERLREILDSEE